MSKVAVVFWSGTGNTEQMAEAVRAEIKTGSSLRGSAEYRRHLAGVLVRRAAHALDAE